MYSGTLPPPLDEAVEFDTIGGFYLPILFFNSYWNLGSEYMPVNDTVKVLTFNGVEASEATVLDKTYKLQRPFVFVTPKNKALSKDAQTFLDYSLSDEAKPFIVKAGVVPAKN